MNGLKDEVRSNRSNPAITRLPIMHEIATPMAIAPQSVSAQTTSPALFASTCRPDPGITGAALGKEKGAADSRVTPSWIVAGDMHNQLLDLCGCLRATRFTDGAAVILLGDQRSIPSQQGIWRDQGTDLEKVFTSDRLGFCRMFSPSRRNSFAAFLSCTGLPDFVSNK